MLAKSWKKIFLIILIIACFFNIVSKFMYKIAFDDVVESIEEKYGNENTNTTNAINE